MAPAYKLTYFDGRGVAEPIRFLFNYGGLEFEDNRVKKDNWPQLKEKTPFGQLPYLEHDGKKVGQSIAIARYVAKQVKLAGKNDWEDLEIDAVVDTFNDLRIKLMVAHFESDEEKKKALAKTAVDETIPYYLTRLEALVQKNNGYLAVGRLTWADLHFASLSPSLDMLTGSDALSKYPKLAALREKVFTLPAIKKWIEKRPKSDF